MFIHRRDPEMAAGDADRPGALLEAQVCFTAILNDLARHGDADRLAGSAQVCFSLAAIEISCALGGLLDLDN